MNNSTKIGIIGGLVVLIGLMFWMMGGERTVSPSSKANFQSSNWDEAYGLQSKDPRGLYLFNRLIKSHLDTSSTLGQINHPYMLDTMDKSSRATFFFIGDQLVLSEDEVDTLLKFVQDGSKLFLSPRSLDGKLKNQLLRTAKLSYYYGRKSIVQIGKNKYPFYYRHKGDTIAKQWFGFKELEVSYKTGPVKTISKLGRLSNNIALPYGKGYVYIASIPELYLNYQMQTSSGYYNANSWIGRIPKNKSVYWLELARYEEYDEFDDFFEDEENHDDSILQLIFGKKERVLAVVLLLVGILFYVLFRAKRTQPIVPFIPKKSNMSIAFADTITSIYYSKRNPRVLLSIQKRNFFDAVQKHFYIDLNHRHEDREITALSQKSNIEKYEIEALLHRLENVNESEITEDYIIDVAKVQIEFYNRAGIISERVQEKIRSRAFIMYRNIWVSSLLLLAGILLTLVGLYYLTEATAIGIILWPIGLFVAVWGAIRLGKPLLTVTEEKITSHPLFGKKKDYDLTHIQRIETSSRSAKIYLEEDQYLTINYWELSPTDAAQFKQFVEKQNKLDL